MTDEEPKIDGIARLVRGCAEQVSVDRTSAITALYDLTAQRLVRFAVTITRNQHDAEDAVHASLVRVSGTPELLLRAQQPWHYLLQMVRNDALQILRRRKPASELGPLDGIVTSNPSEGITAAETHMAVWTALGKLPSEQSEIVVLKVWEEMTFQQISEVLQIPLPTAASRYRYALEKLAVFLRPQFQEVGYE